MYAPLGTRIVDSDYSIPGSLVHINTYTNNVDSRNPISSNGEKENGNHNVGKYITYQLPR